MGWCCRRLGILALVVLRGRTLGRSGLFTFVGWLVDIYMIIIGVMVMGYELWLWVLYFISYYWVMSLMYWMEIVSYPILYIVGY